MTMKRAITCPNGRLLRRESFHDHTSFPAYHHHSQGRQGYLLGHMNYARLKAPMDHPSMDEFRLAIEPVNALAKATPGFVWSLDDQETEQRRSVPLLVQDDLLMPQLSVWTDVEALQHFAFKSGHAMYLKRKREWFTVPFEGQPFAVCWWWRRAVDDNNNNNMSDDDDLLSPLVVPTLKEAFDRLELLQTRGPTADAFDFKSAKQFPKPVVVEHNADHNIPDNNLIDSSLDTPANNTTNIANLDTQISFVAGSR